MYDAQATRRSHLLAADNRLAHVDASTGLSEAMLIVVLLVLVWWVCNVNIGSSKPLHADHLR